MAKLHWLNGEYLRDMSPDRFYEGAIRALDRAGLDPQKYGPEYLKEALDTCRGKIKLFSDLSSYAGFYFTDDVQYDPEAQARELTPENKPRMLRLREALQALDPFNADAIGNTFKAVAQEIGVKPGVLVHPVRLACCGNPAGPSLYHLLAILGKPRALARLDRALAHITC